MTPGAGALRELQGEGLGSTWKVKIAGAAQLDVGAVQRGIQRQVDDVAHQLSRWDSASSLSVLNAANDEDWHALPAGLNEALSYALHLARDTGGAYDPTVAPLVDAWGFGTQGRRYSPPTREQVSAARARVGWAKVELDSAANRVRRPRDVQIDLSSMTHGFAADQVATYLRSIGVTRYLVDVGSELRAEGDGPEDRPWRVAIEQPPPEVSQSPDATQTLSHAQSISHVRSADHAKSVGHALGVDHSPSVSHAQSPAHTPTEPLHVVNLRNAGIATSGNYRYYFDYNGQRYSHRIDPRTGAPITHALASVTVIDPHCMRADALATALTVLGPDEGLDYARHHNIAALFVIRTADGIEERGTVEFKSYLMPPATADR